LPVNEGRVNVSINSADVRLPRDQCLVEDLVEII